MIPPFDHNFVLPPFIGNPARGTQSPYQTNILEFCERFSFSAKRIEILKGFVSFRLEAYKNGLFNYIQWIDGSFVEDKFKAEGKEPNDIDVVTILGNLTDAATHHLAACFPEFIKPSLSKSKYFVDHYIILTSDPVSTIRGTQYWLQLFGHNRRGVWKGMLEIPLGKDESEDLRAMSYLNSL